MGILQRLTRILAGDYLVRSVSQAVPEVAQHLSRYDKLLQIAKMHNPVRMVEIGVWRGDRSVRFLTECTSLKEYVGFDLFEDMTAEKHLHESMGNCTAHAKDAIQHRLSSCADQLGCSVRLIAGSTEVSLPLFSEENGGRFDFIYVDGGHSIETIANDWKWARKLMAPQAMVVFDDYYMNDDSRGAKRLIDSLLHDPQYRVRFFPMIEDIIEDIQITMMTVQEVPKGTVKT